MEISIKRFDVANSTAIRPVILSGGSGTRLWPLSRKAAPKQFHALVGEKTLLQETVARLGGAEAGFLPPLVLANVSHGDVIAKQLADIGAPAEQLILEPMPKNTAPAIAAAALERARIAPDELLLVLPADQAISDAAAFQAALRSGAEAAQAGRIVTFGVEPRGPETGYGYIRKGQSLGGAAFGIASFEEKPNLETAEKFLASGDYLWNAGIFMFRAETMVEELRKYAPETVKAVEAALMGAAREGVSIALDPEAFAQSVDDSIDYAVMERTERAAVVPMNVGWSDVGSWSALWEIAEKDIAGNASIGDEAIMLDCRNALAVSDGRKIAMIGVEDIVVVATDNGILVTRRDACQQVKDVVEQLKADKRTDLL